MNINVNAVNDVPVAVNDTLPTVKTTDVDVFIPVLTNDTLGPDTGETLTVTAVGTVAPSAMLYDAAPKVITGAAITVTFSNC